MNSLCTAKYSAFVGLDWADAKHDICLQAAGSDQREFDCFAHRTERIEQWAQALQQRFGGRIAVALELSKGPIVYALQKYDFLVLFPINPSTLAKYRQAFKPSGAKDDPSDAELALDLLMCHPERFQPIKPQSVPMRQLCLLVEQRRRFVGDKNRTVNRLCSALKQYYPQPVSWFARHDSVLFCDFIARWPTLTTVKRARQATLRTFFTAHNARSEKLINERICAIKAAQSLTHDVAVISAYRMQVEFLIEQLRVILKAIDHFDEEIATTAAKLPDYDLLFRPLPGAGPALAPRLLAGFGENRKRFANAEAIQRYSGVAPVTERSGGKTWIHWRWQCPTFLRQTMVEWAGQTINHSFWAGAYYR